MAEISEFISPKAKKQQEQYISDMRALGQIYSDISVQADHVNKILEQAEKQVTNNAKAKDKLSEAQKEELKLIKDQEKAAEALEKQRQSGLKILAKIEFEERKLQEAMNKEIKSINDAKAANKALRIERDKLSQDTDGYEQKLLDLNKAIDKNDEYIKENTDNLIKQKIGIGGYEDAIRSALDGTNAFSGGTANVIQNFISISEQEGGVKGFFKTFVQGMGSATKAGLKFILTPIGAVIFAIVAAIGLFTAAIKRNQESSDTFSKIWAGITTVIDEVIGRVFKLVGAIGKLISGDWKGFKKESVEAFTGFGKAIANAYSEGQKLLQMQIDLDNATIKSTKSLAELNAETEKQQAIADDSTRSFDEIQAALERVRVTSAQAAREQSNLRKQELDIVNAQVEQAQRQGRLNRELQQEQADAYAAYIDSETAYTLAVSANERERRQLRQDRLEKDLDILIDGFDNVKAINERIIADDKRTIAERQALLLETALLGTRSFEKQIEIIQSFTDKKLDANNLLRESDALLLNDKIRELGLSEILEGRLLEIIRERRTAIADLNEAQVDLIASVVDLKNETFDFGEVEKMMAEDIAKNSEKVTETYQKDLEKFLEVEQKKKEVREEALNQGIELGNTLFGFRQQQLQNELDMNEGNAKKQAEIRAKMARQEKAQAIFNTIVNTAVGIMKTIASVGFPAAIPLVALTGAIGAVQLATIVAKPLPKFANGLKGDYEGLGIFGERGRELKVDPSGKVSMHSKPTLGYIEKGTQIFSNPETERIMKVAANVGYDSPDLKGLRNDYNRGADRIVKAIKGSSLRYDRRRKTLVERTGNTIKKYYDSFQ